MKIKMNLYKFHSDPKSLIHYDEAHEIIPEVFVRHDFEDDEMWQQPMSFFTFPSKMSEKQLSALKKSPRLAYIYAKERLRKRWLEAEQFIEKDSTWWKIYKSHFNIK